MAKGSFHPGYTITSALTAALGQIERARGFLEAATLLQEWVRAMGKRSLILEARHTTHIEGTHLTLDQAEPLLAGEPVPEVDPDDGQKLLNCRQALEFVSEYLDSGAPITEGPIREIHKRLVEGLRIRTRTQSVDHPGVRTPLSGHQPSHAPTGSQGIGG